MTGLHRTQLTTSQKIEFSAKAVAGKEVHGLISQLSTQYNISRPTVYQTQQSIEKMLGEHYAKSEEEHQSVSICVDENQLQRALIALRVIAPNSIRSIEHLLPILYPGVKLSYGSIQGILSEAEENAALFNTQSDLSAIKHSALDEMYSQGNPVLAGIDLDYGYLHSLELKQSRSGADWSEVLNLAKNQGLQLEVVVKDAAPGIENGVTDVFPQAQQRDDCFHVLYDTNKVRRKLRSSAYSAIEYEYTQAHKLGKIRAKEKQLRQAQKTRVAQAKRESDRRIAQYDEFTRAHAHIREAMEYVHGETGDRYNGDDVELMMQKAANILSDIEQSDCKKLSIYINNRASGIAMATQALDDKIGTLIALYSSEQINCACLITRLITSLKKKSSNRNHQKNHQFLLGLYARLCQQLGEHKTDELIRTIQGYLENRYRASSAIEGFNAALRPYLYVHKGVTQNFLELFRAYYNLRTRRWGRHKNTSAHECITGKSVQDWLSILGYPPSKAMPAATLH